MYKVTKEIRFCYGHRLLRYTGKCRHLHGHNAKVEIELSAKRLDPRGMVVDFQEITDVIRSWIDERIDHKMLLNRLDPYVPFLKRQREPIVLLSENPTAEVIAQMIFRYAKKKGFPVTEVRLWETPSSFASYRG